MGLPMGLAAARRYVCVHVCGFDSAHMEDFLWGYLVNFEADQRETEQDFMGNAIQLVLSLGMKK